MEYKIIKGPDWHYLYYCFFLDESCKLGIVEKKPRVIKCFNFNSYEIIEHDFSQVYMEIEVKFKELKKTENGNLAFKAEANKLCKYITGEICMNEHNKNYRKGFCFEKFD